MSDAISVGASADAKLPAKRPRFRWGYSLGALFAVLTAFCFYQAYRTNQQILKYYTPAPAVEYALDVTPYQFTDADFVHPLDPRPASVQLQERVQVITDRIAELRARGDTESADEMQVRLDQILANREGPYSVDGKPQLHAVGIYNGGDPKDEVDPVDGHKIGHSHLRITYKGAPLIVFLCAYDPVRWIVEVSEDVRIEKVILSGYYRQRVEGLAQSIPVENLNTMGAGQSDKIYAFEATYLPKAMEALETQTGLLAQTFFVTHQYEGAPFIIGPESPEWTAMMTLPVIEPLYRDAVRESRTKLAQELIAHPFPEIHCGSGDPFRGTPSNFALHTVFGPYAKSMCPLEKPIRQFAVDPRGPSFFSWHQGITTVDPAAGTIAPWPVPGLENHTGDTRLAFDTKRGRLLLWDRELMAVDILQKRVEVLCNGNQDVRAMTYSPGDDRIYTACAPYDGNSHGTISELRTYNHRGAELSRTKLNMPIPAETLKLSFVDGKLLATALGGRNGSYNFALDTNYVIDPHTGKLLFACRRKPR